MGTPVVTSPWIYQAIDYQGAAISIRVAFNTNTSALQNSQVVRDAACVYTKIYIGLGADGTPNTTLKVFTVPAGTTTVTSAQLAANGLNVIQDVWALQITAGP